MRYYTRISSRTVAQPPYIITCKRKPTRALHQNTATTISPQEHTIAVTVGLKTSDLYRSTIASLPLRACKRPTGSEAGMYASPRQQPYAPTPYGYTPNALSATINLDEEVKFPSNSSDRDLVDSLAEIYSIIVTLDGLEKAFNKDSVKDAEYTEICNRLLKQYKSNLSDERVNHEFCDLENFKSRWKVSRLSLDHGIHTERFLDRLPAGY